MVAQRMYWVLCEAIGAAETLREATGDASYDLDVDGFASWARAHIIERPGEWPEELDAKNSPASGTWVGKPDIYHALQATLMARLPVWPAIGQALAEGRLDEPNPLLPARARKPHRRGFFGRA